MGTIQEIDGERGHSPRRRALARRICTLAAVCVIVLTALSCGRNEDDDVVLFDFETGDLDGWTVTGGNPFYGGGPVSADSMMLWLRAPEGFMGDYLLATGSADGESALNPDGIAVSPPFVISRDYLTFLLAGEVHPHVRVYLETGGRVVREAFGNNFYDLVLRGWDVRDLQGQTARFGLEDQSPHRSLIRIDQVMLTDTPPPTPSDWVTLPSRQRSTLVQPGEFRMLLPSSLLGDGREIVASTIVRGHDGRWHLFAEAAPGGNTGTPYRGAIIHATSDNLTGGWTLDGVVLAIDRAAGDQFLRQPFALFHDGVYYLYYVGSGKPWTGWWDAFPGSPSPSFGGKWGEQGPWSIHLATSTDGHSWTRRGPVLTDTPFAFTPYVHRVGNEWIMYYASAEPADILGRHAIVTRVSDDLVHWSDRRVPVMTDHEYGASPWPEKSFVQNPFVFKRGEVWYLFAGPIDNDNLAARDCLRVFTSTSPLNWNITAGRGRVFAGHGSVIRDDDGAWYITHNSADSGGVWIAPLVWADGLDNEPASIAAGVAAIRGNTASN